MIAAWEMVDTTWETLMFHQLAFHVKNGTYNIRTSTFNLQMCFHKYKTPKIIAVMPEVRNLIRGVTQWTIRFDGNRVTFRCVVSYQVDGCLMKIVNLTNTKNYQPIHRMLWHVIQIPTWQWSRFSLHRWYFYCLALDLSGSLYCICWCCWHTK